jgi:hypothetical protein
MDFIAPFDDPSPFGPLPVNLAERNLTSDEKSWIGRQIVDRTLTVAKAARRFNLKRDVLKKWARYIREGIRPQEKVGRPRIIDEEGVFDAGYKIVVAGTPAQLNMHYLTKF